MSIPANLIINADDFGLDSRVSRAIAQCLDEGLINSFSIFPFVDEFHHALLRKILAKHPNVKVGCHLSLIHPNIAASVNAGVANLKENPLHFLQFLTCYLCGQFPAHFIYRLWKSQILFVGGFLGGTDRIAHLDSHQHLHMLPGIWPVAVELQKEFGIPRLRVPYESFTRSLLYRFPFGFGMQAMAGIRRASESRKFIGFFSSTRFTVNKNRLRLTEAVQHPEFSYELMVHPALPLVERVVNPGQNGSSETVSGAPLTTLANSQFDEVEELRRLQDFFKTTAQNSA